MQSVLIIVPAGGMLFEAAGIVDILMQANRLKSTDSHKQLYQVTIAATQPHRVVQGFSGMSLLADVRRQAQQSGFQLIAYKATRLSWKPGTALTK